MNDKTHKQIRAWLASEEPLDAGAETAVHTHLQSCADCRAYAERLFKGGTGRGLAGLDIDHHDARAKLERCRIAGA